MCPARRYQRLCQNPHVSIMDRKPEYCMLSCSELCRIKVTSWVSGDNGGTYSHITKCAHSCICMTCTVKIYIYWSHNTSYTWANHVVSTVCRWVSSTHVSYSEGNAFTSQPHGAVLNEVFHGFSQYFQLIAGMEPLIRSGLQPSTSFMAVHCCIVWYIDSNMK